MTLAIRKFAIKNAIDYGKADAGSVLGKVIPQARGIPVPELKKEVQKIVGEINSLKKNALEKEYAPFKEEFEKRAEETVKKTEKPKLVLEGAEMGKVATRIPPGPNGYLHIGHMKQAVLSSELAKMYDGKFFRYFDDTNPEKDRQEYVDAMIRDHEWMGFKFAKTYYASDMVDKIYDYAKQLIKIKKAYVCGCSREEIKEKRFAGKQCKHRKQGVEDNMALFEGMLNGKIKQGAAIVRFMGDMKAANTVLRDPALLRIIETPHYRQGTKYRVWPVYDFNTPIVDSLQGVTDVLRSKEFELRGELGRQILGALGLRVPRIHEFSRLNINGNVTAKRIIRKLIAEGQLKSWDDPRLMTLMALRRRGIRPEAIANFIMKIGMTKSENNLPFEMLLAENRKVIDPIAKHLFFVANPVRLTVLGARKLDAHLRLHPGADFGFRDYETGEAFYISKDDADQIKKGAILRLKDLVDVKIKKVEKNGIVADMHEDIGGKDSRIIQWVPEDNHVECTVQVIGPLLDENENVDPNSLQTVSGYVESYAEKLDEHEIVQFERFGYCILDDKKNMRFIFISK